MKIAVTAPIYITNDIHKLFVDQTTKSIKSQEHELVFIPVENYIHGRYAPFNYILNDGIQLHKMSGKQQQSVASGWNLGITKAREIGCEYILIINTDIILKSNSIDRLVELAMKMNNPEYVLWTMGQYASPDENVTTYDEIVADLEKCPEDNNISEHPNFSSFLIKADFVEKMGLFDENIKPAYFEDNDMHARIALDNKKAVVYGGARFFHYGSRTINSDPEFRVSMPPMFEANRDYFKAKWGVSNVGDVEEMRKVYWKHPYNEEDKPLNYWRGQ